MVRPAASVGEPYVLPGNDPTVDVRHAPRSPPGPGARSTAAPVPGAAVDDVPGTAIEDADPVGESEAEKSMFSAPANATLPELLRPANLDEPHTARVDEPAHARARRERHR